MLTLNKFGSARGVEVKTEGIGSLPQQPQCALGKPRSNPVAAQNLERRPGANGMVACRL